MIAWFWRKFAEFCARPEVFAWIAERSLATPYYHLRRSSTQLYMARYWFFNSWSRETKRRRWPLPISARLHYIAGPDEGPEHSHPWKTARSIILRGWYLEQRGNVSYMRSTGTTSTLKFGEFHKITQVSPRGCWTLFIMYRKCGGWGFKSQ